MNAEQSEDCAKGFALSTKPCKACDTTDLAPGAEYCDPCHDDMAERWKDDGPTDEELDAWADLWALKENECENPF